MYFLHWTNRSFDYIVKIYIPTVRFSFYLFILDKTQWSSKGDVLLATLSIYNTKQDVDFTAV